MRYKKFFQMILLAGILFLLGRNLKAVYGMEPPYIVYFGGYVLEVISYILIVVTVWIIIFDIFKLRSTRKEP